MANTTNNMQWDADQWLYVVSDDLEVAEEFDLSSDATPEEVKKAAETATARALAEDGIKLLDAVGAFERLVERLSQREEIAEYFDFVRAGMRP